MVCVAVITVDLDHVVEVIIGAIIVVEVVTVATVEGEVLGEDAAEVTGSVEIVGDEVVEGEVVWLAVWVVVAVTNQLPLSERPVAQTTPCSRPRFWE